jgi:hypothetical protein
MVFRSERWLGLPDERQLSMASVSKAVIPLSASISRPLRAHVGQVGRWRDSAKADLGCPLHHGVEPGWIARLDVVAQQRAPVIGQRPGVDVPCGRSERVLQSSHSRSPAPFTIDEP